jgi:hypothetical protein
MTSRIISISGFKGHGKDTVGRILKDQFGFQTTSFAEPLKQVLSVMFGWDPNNLEGITPESRAWREQPDPFWSEKLGKPFTPRQAMTEIGTDLIRHKFLNTMWCDLMEQKLSQVSGDWVITDARFTNELQLIKDLGGVCVWVKRQPLPEWYAQAEWLNKRPAWQRPVIKPFLKGLKGVHESETNWVGWDFDHVIDNTGSLDDLSDLIHMWHKQLT